jgi:hypothetical protein
MNTLTSVKGFSATSLKQIFKAISIKTIAFNSYSAFFSVVVLLLMLALPMWFVFNDMTFSTHFEESVGFRYFHSLRILYGHEYPWLPQGQLSGILHIVVQKALTLFGHPIDEFFPRIDLFSTWCVVLPLIMASGIYYWTTKPIKSLFLQAVFAIIFLGCFYSPRYQDGWMLLPDYHIWIISLSLLAVGWCLRTLTKNPLFYDFTNKSAILFGIYAGLCLSVKVTLITYPATIGLMILALNRRYLTLARLSLISVPITFIVWSAVLLVYYQGKFSVISKHYLSLIQYTDSQVQLIRDNSLEFLQVFFPLTILDVFPIIPLLLGYSLWSIYKYRMRSFIGSLLLVGLLELYMLYQRNYTHTNIEVQYLFLIIGTIISIRIYQNTSVVRQFVNWVSTNPARKYNKYRFVVISLLLAVPTLAHVSYSLNRNYIFTSWITELNPTAKGLHNAIAKNPGQTLFLIPITASVDEFNLRTIDNGLFKSATGLSPLWENGAYVVSLYSNRWYASNVATLPALNAYQNIVFRTRANEPLAQTMVRLENHYQTSFTEFNCKQPYFSYTIPTEETLVFCTKTQAMK